MPAPFNLMPTMKTIMRTVLRKKKDEPGGSVKVGVCVYISVLYQSHVGKFQIKSKAKAQEEHDVIMHILLRRYVTAEQRKRDEYGITEDDVIEIRQDISSLRYELVDILRTNGMKTPSLDHDQAAGIFKCFRQLSSYS